MVGHEVGGCGEGGVERTTMARAARTTIKATRGHEERIMRNRGVKKREFGDETQRE